MSGVYWSLLLYFSGLGLLGWLASRKVHSAADFFVGGKKLPSWIAALSAQATGESAWLLLGLTGLGALIGVSAYWVAVGEFLGVFVAWFLMAGRFKQQAEQSNALTVTDYLAFRFRQHGTLIRALSAIALTVFSIIYISAEIDAIGAAFEHFLGWNYYAGAISGFLFVAMYCVVGGFLAVAWTDTVQGIIMLVGLAGLPVAGLLAVAMPANEIMGVLGTIDPLLTRFWPATDSHLMSLCSVLGLMAVGLGFMGSPQIFSRFIAIRDQNEIRSGRWIALFYTLIVDCAAVSIGILGRVLFTSSADPVEALLGNGAQNILPVTVSSLLPEYLSGFYIAAVLAAIMSTISSLLLLASSSLTWDFYRQLVYINMEDKAATALSRRLTWVLAFIALALALSVAIVTPGRTVFWFALLGWSGIAAAFCPVVILSLFWKDYSSAGALGSMASGFLMVLLCKLVFQHLDGIGPYMQAVETLPPAFLVSLLFGWAFSRVLPDRPILPAGDPSLFD
ncbi:sodium/proline symporter [Endozoicomonadaceae bacterium StTr2]